MISFRVENMTCAHCVNRITKAVMGADARAQVKIDLPNHLVGVDAGDLNAEQLVAVIAEAGYSPVLISASGLTG